ncbi:MAG: hypothetical protein WCI17_07375 [bacterium]
MLQPDVLSIKVGVNDVWRLQGEWQGQRHIPLPAFRANYRILLELAAAAGHAVIATAWMKAVGAL